MGRHHRRQKSNEIKALQRVATQPDATLCVTKVSAQPSHIDLAFGSLEAQAVSVDAPDTEGNRRVDLRSAFEVVTGGSAAGATGRRQPSNSRSRTPYSRSGSHRVAPPPAAFRGTADVAGDAVAATSAGPSTHAKPRGGEVERLLILGSTGHSRPLAVVRPV